MRFYGAVSFHFINFPSKETMKEIIAVHHPKIKTSLVQEALEMFFELREIPWPEEKAVHVRADRLAQVADGG